MKRVLVADDADGRSAAVPMRGTARVEVEFAVQESLDDATLGVVVKDAYNTPIFGINNKVTPAPAQPKPLRSGRVICRLPELPLMPGVYPLDLYFGNRIQDFDVIYNAAELTVVPADVFGTGKLPHSSAGPICWPATWEIVPAE
jgi:hypothetical protein